MTWAQVREYGLAQDVPRFVDALVEVARSEGFWGNQLQQLKKVLDVNALPCRVPVAVALTERIPQIDDGNARTFLEYVVEALLDDYGRTVDLEEARAVLAIAARSWAFYPTYRLAELGQIVLKSGETLSDEAIAVMRRCAAGPYGDKTLKAFVAKIRHPLLNRGEPWADRVLHDLSTLDGRWPDLVAHAVTVTDARPSHKWEKRSRMLLAEIGQHNARRVITGWLALLGLPRTLPLSSREYEIDIEFAVDPFNANAVRGLVWLLGLVTADIELARMLANLVETNLRKVPGIGPRHPKVADAAVYALSRLEGEDALAQLAGLTSRVSHKATLQELHEILAERAAQLRVTRDELAELAVSSYGLTEVGRRVERFGQDTATLHIDKGRVRIDWHNSAGQRLNSAPTAVKLGFAEELNQLKTTAAEIGRVLTARTAQLERDFASQRVWRFGFWRERWLNHPLLGTVARRLLWQVEGRPCGFADGGLRTLDGSPVRAADGAQVRLWHPAGDECDQARDWLEQHAIVPPFAQLPASR